MGIKTGRREYLAQCDAGVRKLRDCQDSRATQFLAFLGLCHSPAIFKKRNEGARTTPYCDDLLHPEVAPNPRFTSPNASQAGCFCFLVQKPGVSTRSCRGKVSGHLGTCMRTRTNLFAASVAEAGQKLSSRLTICASWIRLQRSMWTAIAGFETIRQILSIG